MTSLGKRWDFSYHTETSSLLIGYKARLLGRVALSACTLCVGIPLVLWRGCSNPGKQHPRPFHLGFLLGSPLVGGSRILKKNSRTQSGGTRCATRKMAAASVSVASDSQLSVSGGRRSKTLLVVRQPLRLSLRLV